MTMLSITPPCEPLRTGFLLLDPANLEDDTFSAPLAMVACTPAALSQSAHLTPRLIDIAALSAAQQDELSEVLSSELIGKRAPLVCAWLDCAQDAKALARHIGRFLVGPGPDGAEVYWRYFDPRVFVLAMQVLDAEQTASLLGPITHWRFPWCQRWWSVSGPGKEADPLLGIAPAWPGKKQWGTIDNSASVARAMAKLCDGYLADEVVPDGVFIKLLRNIDASMQDARQRLHLSDPDDLVEYACYAVSYGEPFHRHPKLNDVWEELVHGKISWSRLVGMLDQTDVQLFDEKNQMKIHFKGIGK